ncbi:MAG: S8 family serine peptidase, partial [Flavisolibacter sp.]
DNADVQTHVDFNGRLINRAAQALTSAHGYHTTGTLAGAGNVNEYWRGYAPKATIVSQSFNGIILNAPAYVTDYGMVVTNNSYGDNIDCGYMGTYDLYSRLLDQMAFDLPSLTNVFAAGNSGTGTCGTFLPGYHTVLGGYQSSKNVVVVGATDDVGNIASFSSRGPVRDGRIKPDITAMGKAVGSCAPNNGYFYNNGTSMAAPAVTGGLALLYQRYRQLNGGTNPKNGLMKALICNGAVDQGNPGPDFKYGYGWMNLLRSVDMLENNHYIISSCTNGSTNTHTISVPANTAQLKVMLYWNDPAASPLSAKTLVNDLDLEVADVSLSTNLPNILDTTNANLDQAAVSGADHMNNIEQVVINNPAVGNYTIKVKGTAITQNPSQEYFVVYDPIPVQLKITTPVGGDGLVPASSPTDQVKITWEAYGYSSGTVMIEFSSDGGASWNTVATGVDINKLLYLWAVPAIPTSNALIRITKEGSGETTTSNPFTIVGQPTVSLDPVQCEGYINLNWSAITGATDYEVMMLQGDEMKSISTTTSTTYTFSGLSKDSVYWVTVRARVNGKPGRRAVAISRQPSSGSCSGTISDNDLKIDAILAPASGRLYTSTQLTASTPVTVRVKNLDDAAVSNFDLKYSINGGSFVTENVAATIPAGGTYTYTFTTTADLSVPGHYNFVAIVKNSTTDPVTANDTAFMLVRHADNQPLNLSSYFVDDIEAATPATYEKDTVALDGLERYDFSRSTIYGRLRTFVNSGIAYSGTKALTLDANRYYTSGNTNYLYGTYNLTNYNVNTNDIRLDFQFANHGQVFNANNQVWIRGNDASPWIQAYDLNANQLDPGTYKKSSSIEVSHLLAANGQTLSPSFQVAWGQWGFIAATDMLNANGYSFDDIRVYQVFNDMQMLSIDAPVSASCGLTNNSTIQVTVRNSSNAAINNVPVKYRINSGGWVSELISSVAANSTIQYSFTTGADLSAVNTYNIQAIVDLSGDSFRENDTANVTVTNSPVINSFPYLQDFETNNGNWYPGGTNSSWQYGTPTSTKINRAASGAKAWKTRLQGNYNDLEGSYLYSPCFD